MTTATKGPGEGEGEGITDQQAEEEKMAASKVIQKRHSNDTQDGQVKGQL